MKSVFVFSFLGIAMDFQVFNRLSLWYAHAYLNITLARRPVGPRVLHRPGRPLRLRLECAPTSGGAQQRPRHPFQLLHAGLNIQLHVPC